MRGEGITRGHSPIPVVFCLLMCCFIFPTGSLFNVPLKYFFTGLLYVMILAEGLRPGGRLVLDEVARGLLVVLGAIGISCLIALVHGNADATLLCLKAFLALVLVVFAAWILLVNGIVGCDLAARILLFVSIAIVALKIVCELAVLIGAISPTGLKDAYAAVFGIDAVVGTSYVAGDFWLCRIAVPNDVIPVAVFSFFILFGNRGLGCKFVAIAALAVFSVIVFSRFFFLQVAICIGFPILLLVARRAKRSRRLVEFVVLLLAFAVLALLVALMATDVLENGRQGDVEANPISSMLEYRFRSNETAVSDSIRSDQFRCLTAGILDRPFFGNGFGSYAEECIRDSSDPYSYELEYVSFVYQMGFIGFVIIIGGLIFLFYRICTTGITDKTIKAIALTNLAIWLLRPLFNPSFVSSNSACLIVCIAVMGMYYQGFLDCESAKVKVAPRNI